MLIGNVVIKELKKIINTIKMINKHIIYTLIKVII